MASVYPNLPLNLANLPKFCGPQEAGPFPVCAGFTSELRSFSSPENRHLLLPLPTGPPVDPWALGFSSFCLILAWNSGLAPQSFSLIRRFQEHLLQCSSCILCDSPDHGVLPLPAPPPVDQDCRTRLDFSHAPSTHHRAGKQSALKRYWEQE